MNLVVKLARRLRSLVVHVVPRELVVCERNETTCTSADWKECRWRRKMTPDRSSRPLNDRGLKL